MNLKIRYGLIAAGFITFAVLAPLILLYVRGLSLNTKDLTTDQTGIISIQTEPKGAEVFLNNQQNGTTPENIRFLKPGDYEIELRKPDYFTWSKRLTVFPGKVSWATQDVSKVHLLKQDLSKLKLDTGVKDFFRTDTQVIYLTEQALNKISLKNPAQKKVEPLAKDEYSILTSPSKNYALLFGKKHFYTYSQIQESLSKIENFPSEFTPLSLDDSGNFYGLSKNSLVKYNQSTKAKLLTKNNVQAFFQSEENIYTLSKKQNSWQLEFLDSQNKYTPQIIFSTETELTKPEIFISPERRIYIKDGQKLYRFAGKLEMIFNSTQSFIKSESGEKILISASGEIHLYNPYTNDLKLINRNLEGYSNFLLRDDLGYVFTATGKELKAIELDTRDRSNIFSLSEFILPKKISSDSLAKNLVYLDGTDLKFLTLK